MAQPVSQETIMEIFGENPVPESQELRFNHTSYRIKDPVVSLRFYRQILGMKLYEQVDMENHRATVFFIGCESDCNNVFLHLLHVWGTENIPDFKYSTGNDEHKGFGHICLKTPDVNAYCRAIEKLGVKFIKRPWEGDLDGTAYIQDPDGYCIEIISEVRGREGWENPPGYNEIFQL